MTGPARVRRAIVGVVALSFLSVTGYAIWWINGRLLALPRGEWSTQHFANPVELIAGETTIRVTRFVIDFERESLTLERDELSFNDYGDATRTGGQEPLTFHVQFSREDTEGFEIVLKNGFRQRFRLVVSPSPANTHRLIVLGESRGWDRRPMRIFDLRGSAVVPDEIGDPPQPEAFRFNGLATRQATEGGRESLGQVEVSGTLAKGGYLYLDPNRYGFSPNGSITSSTMMAGPLFPVVFKPLEPDPADRRRRAYELHADENHPVPWEVWAERTNLTRVPPGRFILVLGPTELSEHRLVIKHAGVVHQVLRLRNMDRDNHRYMLGSLDAAPVDEQKAYRELTQISGYQTIASVWKGHVTSISRLQGEKDKINPILARFPFLSQVHFMDGETRKLP